MQHAKCAVMCGSTASTVIMYHHGLCSSHPDFQLQDGVFHLGGHDCGAVWALPWVAHGQRDRVQQRHSRGVAVTAERSPGPAAALLWHWRHVLGARGFQAWYDSCLTGNLPGIFTVKPQQVEAGMTETEHCRHVSSAFPPDLRSQVGLPSAGSAAAGLARLKRLSTGRSESIEIEMTEIEHEPDSCHSPSAGVLRTSEYAGSREGVTVLLP